MYNRVNTSIQVIVAEAYIGFKWLVNALTKKAVDRHFRFLKC